MMCQQLPNGEVCKTPPISGVDGNGPVQPVKRRTGCPYNECRRHLLGNRCQPPPFAWSMRLAASRIDRTISLIEDDIVALADQYFSRQPVAQRDLVDRLRCR